MTVPAKTDAPPRLIEAPAEQALTPYNVKKDAVAIYGLSPAEWVFIQEYVSTNNHIEAYQKAFNCTRGSAYGSARKLLRRPEIQKVVHDLMAELGRTMGAQREALRALLWREATDPMNKGGDRIKAIEQLTKLEKMVDDGDKNGKTGAVPMVNVNIVADKPPEVTVVMPDEEPVVVMPPPKAVPKVIEAEPVVTVGLSKLDEEIDF